MTKKKPRLSAAQPVLFPEMLPPYFRLHASLTLLSPPKVKGVASTMEMVCATSPLSPRKRRPFNQQSSEAFRNAQPCASERNVRILQFLKSRGQRGATAEEVSIELGMRLSSASARCTDLKKHQLIRKSGCVRATTSGSMAAVLVYCGDVAKPENVETQHVTPETTTFRTKEAA